MLHFIIKVNTVNIVETNKAESSHKEHKNQEDVVLKKRHEGQNKRRAPWTNKYSNLAPVESHIKGKLSIKEYIYELYLETSPHKEEVQEIPEVVKEKEAKPISNQQEEKKSKGFRKKKEVKQDEDGFYHETKEVDEIAKPQPQPE